MAGLTPEGLPYVGGWEDLFPSHVPSQAGQLGIPPHNPRLYSGS